VSGDIVTRLRRWVHAVDAVPASDLMDEAADEIERLRSRLRFCDRVIRSGDVATLTDDEREAIVAAIRSWPAIGVSKENVESLRGLLERLG
jgi:hypothetical protein